MTPLLMEFVNTRTAENSAIQNVIKGWPAYAINVIVCVAVAFIVCVLPSGWEISFFNVVILTFAIYFGNQFVFNTFVKPLAIYRR